MLFTVLGLHLLIGIPFYVDDPAGMEGATWEEPILCTASHLCVAAYLCFGERMTCHVSQQRHTPIRCL